jgi:hypothetical protein
MLHADSTDEPPSGFACNFWYARTLAIFHINVQDLRRPNSPPQCMEFLFIRWLGQELGWVSGWQVMCLEHVGFVPLSDGNAFGFVNPSLVVRSTHLIPTFVNGRTGRLLGQSRLSRDPTEHNDWDTFYVNM